MNSLLRRCGVIGLASFAVSGCVAPTGDGDFANQSVGSVSTFAMGGRLADSYRPMVSPYLSRFPAGLADASAHGCIDAAATPLRDSLGDAAQMARGQLLSASWLPVASRSLYAPDAAAGSPAGKATASTQNADDAFADIDSDNDTADADTAANARNAAGFKQQGRASWYGRDFQGRRTASGERYDMHAFTAAHRTLALNSYVRVTNADNDKSVVVKINDRGPFSGKRIIDLSFAAARAIGIQLSGVAHVRLTGLSAKEAQAERTATLASR